MYKLPPLNALRSFESVGRNGSVVGAARDLNVTEPAVSRAIKILEDHFGIALFHRHTNGMELTEQGKLLLPVMSEALRNISDACGAIYERRRHRVSILATPFIASHWLARRLSSYLADDAQVSVFVHSSFRFDELKRAEFDIALWYGDVEKAGYAVEPFLTMTRVPTCSEAFAEMHDLAEDATRLRDCSLIHEFDYSDWMHCFESAGLDPMDAAHGIVSDNFELTIQSALNDVGVALLFENIAETITSRARLIHPLGSTIAVPVQYSMLIQECRRDDPAVHEMAEFLRACARSSTDRRVEEASPLH